MLPEYIGVLVTTEASMKGSRATGNIVDVVVVRVDAPGAYRADPGHPASGVIGARRMHLTVRHRSS